MIKARHYFFKNVNTNSVGVAYQVGDKDTNAVIVISTGDATDIILAFMNKSTAKELV